MKMFNLLEFVSIDRILKRKQDTADAD